MSMKDRLVEQGKKLTTSTAFVRLVSNDKVMQLATGVMDARSRFQAVAEHAAEAWSIVLHGHALPTIDGGARVALEDGPTCSRNASSS
jgi:8-amino-7-oxononanoate synthase